MNRALTEKEFIDERVWSLPRRIDSHNADGMQQHIVNVVQLEEGARLILDLEPLALLDFSGVGFLLDLIARARRKNIHVVLQTKNKSLAALLHLMQFDLVADIAAGEVIIDVESFK